MRIISKMYLNERNHTSADVPRLFLTGPIGCGKSTVIFRSLGKSLSLCGGFLTRRSQKQGETFFTLESTDGRIAQTFLRASCSKPYIKPEVFLDIGVPLLRGDVLVLDETGGIDLLSPEFSDAPYQLFKGDIPIIGVLKSQHSLKIMAQALGISGQIDKVIVRH